MAEFSKEKLNIAILTDSFFPGTGGTENAVHGLADALVKMGHNVMVCAPKYWDAEDNYSYLVNRSKSVKMSANYYNATPGRSKQFKNTLLNFKPDILHCNTNGAMLVFSNKFAKKYNVPLVTTIHTKFSYTLLEDTHSKLITKICCKVIGKRLKKCDTVCAVSQTMDKEFEIYGYKKQFDVVKNGSMFNASDVDNVDVELARKKYNISENDNVLLFVGRVAGHKNVDFIFQSLQKLNQNYQNFKMMFVGSILDKQFYEKVTKSDIADKVVFTNNISDKRMLHSLYSNAKLFLFPSVFDNDCLTVVEASMYKVPSIVLQNTGSSERITNNKNGFAVEHDTTKYAQKIEELLKNPEYTKQVGIQANKDLPKDWQTTANEYLEIYANIINKKIRK